jgi:ketosteroid isomerase-like protein
MGIDADIHNLIGRYCDAVLRADIVEFESTWSSDARWLIPGDGIITGRDAITETFKKLRPAYRQCVQEVLNGTIAYEDGDSATARWQIRERQWHEDGTVTELIGVYHDVMNRDLDGVLRFTQRDFELIYSGPIDGTGRVRAPRTL